MASDVLRRMSFPVQSVRKMPLPPCTRYYALPGPGSAAGGSHGR